MINKVLLFSLLFLFSATIYSQIVNVEKKRTKTNGFQTAIGLDINIKETGSKIFEVKNNIDLQYSKNEHTFIFLNNISLLKVNNSSLLNSGFQHLRYNYTIKDSSSITIEFFGQHQYNELKLLNKRVLFGFGPRYRILDKKRIIWYFAPLAMYEYEKLSDELSSEFKLLRLDAYTNFSVSLNDQISFNLIAYYQPNFADFSDFRLSGESGFRLKILKYLSYEINYACDYDNAPPTDIQNTFWYFTNKLIIKF